MEKLESVGVLHEGALRLRKASLFEMEVGGGNRILCPGDSGGGLFDVRPGEAPVVVGVGVRTQIMPYSARCTGPSAATRVAPYVACNDKVLKSDPASPGAR